MSALNTQSWLDSFREGEESKKNFYLSKTTKTISITGGKGGVGKTSVSLKLAKELASRDNKVLLIDCDYNLANTSIKLGLPINSNFYDLISMQKNFQECLYKEGSFHLLSGCNGDLNLFEDSLELDKIVIDIINEHKLQYDYILIDCPAGLNKKVLNINAYCDNRVMVITPDKSSVTDSYSLMKVLKMKYGVKENHILINKISSKIQFQKVIRTISETVEHYLNSRTIILGGIKRLDEFPDKFDKALLNDENSAVHRSFVKVVDLLSDKQIRRGSVGIS